MSTTAERPATTTAGEETGGQADGSIRERAEQQQLSLLPQIDGRTRTKLRISLSGTIELEPHDERDAELVRRLSIGSKVDAELVGTGIRFELVTGDKADKARLSNDGYIEDVVHSVKLRALSLSHPGEPREGSDAAANRAAD